MNKNLGVRSVCNIHMGAFGLENVKVILRSFSALSSVRDVCNMHMGAFDFETCQGHFGVAFDLENCGGQVIRFTFLKIGP